MKSSSQNFLSTIHSIELLLSHFYQFNRTHSAIDFLISSEELPALVGKEKLSNSNRAAVYFSEDHDELFIGVHFEESIINKINLTSPNTSLNNSNLDAFIVVVEEISHFHLILDRAQRGQKLTLLELEWQAEIDKLLVSGLFLFQHVADPHVAHLKKIMFEQAKITSENINLYQEASYYADKFWRDFISAFPANKNCFHSNEFRSFMQESYEKPLQIKQLYVSKKKILAA
jgi:hypothetical protein